MVTLRTFINPIDAHLAKNQLENEGISCVLLDQHMTTMYPGAGIVGGIRLNVDEADLELAKAVLDRMVIE